jgi:hypothetical protein
MVAGCEQLKGDRNESVLLAWKISLRSIGALGVGLGDLLATAEVRCREFELHTIVLAVVPHSHQQQCESDTSKCQCRTKGAGR